MEAVTPLLTLHWPNPEFQDSRWRVLIIQDLVLVPGSGAGGHTTLG